METSKRDRLIAALLASGGVVRPNVSKKYTVIELACRTYLVGKSGGLRVTRSTIGDSMSLTGSVLYKHFIDGGTWQTWLDFHAQRAIKEARSGRANS